mgnify:CR=1 FL=1
MNGEAEDRIENKTETTSQELKVPMEIAKKELGEKSAELEKVKEAKEATKKSLEEAQTKVKELEKKLKTATEEKAEIEK